MVEMAAHIGAYEVLRLCEVYGGQQVYFPVDPANAPLVEILGGAKAKRLCKAFQRERITIPTARHALSIARRASVIAAARAGDLSVAAAAAKLGLRRDTVSTLIRSSDEGFGLLPETARPDRGQPRQIELFDAAPGDEA